MKAELFYAVTSGASLLAIGAEAVYARRRGKSWHSTSDTIGNLNLAAGNVLLGVALAGIVGAGYGLLCQNKIVDVPARLPSQAAVVVVAVVLADFLQYWNHRLSHRMNFLWWGHITHHSSSYLNLSTGIRVNWLYRSYAWLLYAPMPLLGFSLEAFIVSQAVINVYNLFMHTRFDLPVAIERSFGWLFVTPASHRLHHSADPRYFGNYGAAFIVWDRFFGTYREIARDEEKSLSFGVDHNVDSSDPLRLNFHYLAELRARAVSERRSMLGLFLSTTALPSRTTTEARSRGRRVSVGSWVGVALLVVLAVGINQVHARLSLAGQIGAVVFGIGLVTAFGVFVDRSTSSEARLR